MKKTWSRKSRVRLPLNKKIIENWGVGTGLLKHPRDLQICDGGMSPRICGFADLWLKKCACPLLRINRVPYSHSSLMSGQGAAWLADPRFFLKFVSRACLPQLTGEKINTQKDDRKNWASNYVFPLRVLLLASMNIHKRKQKKSGNPLHAWLPNYSLNFFVLSLFIVYWSFLRYLKIINADNVPGISTEIYENMKVQLRCVLQP